MTLIKFSQHSQICFLVVIYTYPCRQSEINGLVLPHLKLNCLFILSFMEKFNPPLQYGWCWTVAVAYILNLSNSFAIIAYKRISVIGMISNIQQYVIWLVLKRPYYKLVVMLVTSHHLSAPVGLAKHNASSGSGVAFLHSGPVRLLQRPEHKWDKYFMRLLFFFFLVFLN